MMSMTELKSKPPFITLITDFGTQDWFVGVMKGVIAGIQPSAQVIDITHSITPGSIREGAFVCKQSYLWFPDGTIHLAVVDPGVGTSRKAIVVKTPNGYCVGPDNGLFSWAFTKDQVEAVYEIQPDRLNRSMSDTFHGRDLFAPAAAMLAAGVDISDWTSPIKDFIKLDWPSPSIDQQQIKGEILHIDRFGNMITNLPSHEIRDVSEKLILRDETRGQGEKVGLYPTYGKAPTGKRSLIAGSTGYLEWAIPNGNAAQISGWQVGDTFLLTTGQSE